VDFRPDSTQMTSETEKLQYKLAGELLSEWKPIFGMSRYIKTFMFIVVFNMSLFVIISFLSFAALKSQRLSIEENYKTSRVMRCLNDNCSLSMYVWQTWTSSHILPPCFNNGSLRFFKLFKWIPILDPFIVCTHLAKIVQIWSMQTDVNSFKADSEESHFTTQCKQAVILLCLTSLWTSFSIHTVGMLSFETLLRLSLFCLCLFFFFFFFFLYLQVVLLTLSLMLRSNYSEK
jgi:hypothetical protein